MSLTEKIKKFFMKTEGATNKMHDKNDISDNFVFHFRHVLEERHKTTMTFETTFTDGVKMAGFIAMYRGD